MPKPHPYEARSGKVTWKVRYRLGKTGSMETFDTERAAQIFCDDIKNRGPVEALRILFAAQSPEGPTLDELAERFFEWKAGRVRSDRTVSDYRRDYDNWISPGLGSRVALTITEMDVQGLIDDMGSGKTGRKLSPKSIHDRHAILYGILSWAAHPARRLIAHNAAVGTDLPKKTRSQPKGLRPAEWQALHAALLQIDRDAADLAEFMLATGWRFSEAAALSAHGVEDDGLDIHVSMGQVIRRNADGKHVIVADGKSAAAIRRVKLDDAAADMVRRRMDTVRGNGLVFTTRTGRQWHYSNFRDRAWVPAVTASGLSSKPTPHWLRHTSVAWLVMTGKVNLPEIQRRIGHESIQTTINVYGRMINDVSPDALDAFAALRGEGAARQIEA